jgi:hypothetical protein
MEIFFYKKEHSLSNELCEEIINMFENEKHNHHPGSVSSGIKPSVRNTNNLTIESNFTWTKIKQFLERELTKNIREYVKIIEKNLGIDSLFELNNFFFAQAMQIVKYNKNDGFYIYHTDYNSHFNIITAERVISFIWYLNDVEIGGETEFFNKVLIKAERGKLLLFPSHINFPHCGKMPISNDKYIIVGWLYAHKDEIK